MKHKDDFIDFQLSNSAKIMYPIIDLKDVLIPWDRCFSVNLGVVEPRAISTMIERHFDYAPIYSNGGYRKSVIGLISGERLKELLRTGKKLEPTDHDIKRPELFHRSDIGSLLENLKLKTAFIVVGPESRRSHEALGLLTRADLNRHAFRSSIYSLIADMELELAKLIRESFADPIDWLDTLSEDKQARLIGYWEVSKRRNVDIGPLGAATLTELLDITAKSEKLLNLLAYPGRKSFRSATGKIPEIRNQIMHPVRPLITNVESIDKLKNCLEKILFINQRLAKAKKKLKTLPISS